MKRGKYLQHRWYVRWFCQFLRLWMSTTAVGRFTGIPKTTIYSWYPRRDRRITKGLKKAIPLLGLESDASIARKTRLSTACIRDQRRYKGIPPYREYKDLQGMANKQVNQELMNAWQAP